MKRNYEIFLDGKYSSLAKNPDNKDKTYREKSEEEIHSFYDKAVALAAIGGALLGASVWNQVKRITDKLRNNNVTKSDIHILDKIRTFVRKSASDDQEKSRIMSFLDDLKSSVRNLT